jgi:hypothetical protein
MNQPRINPNNAVFSDALLTSSLAKDLMSADVAPEFRRRLGRNGGFLS